jgi:peptide methionine sulfoxide reductase msrA/msrB
MDLSVVKLQYGEAFVFMIKLHWVPSAVLALAGMLSARRGVKPTVNGTVQTNEETGENLPATGIDQTYVKQEGVEVIYLAGGCFWGLEKLMQSIPGVEDAVSGYANGKANLVPTYGKVSAGNTGYRETVRVTYRPNDVSLDAILFAYFMVIDPAIENAQGNDIGTQYQTGVYYADPPAAETIARIAAIEHERNNRFVVEIKPLERFYAAEEYHQDYLDKNPSGYCHISRYEMSIVGEMIVDPGDYQRPPLEQIRAMLTEQQYRVTQRDSTELPFDNAYWNNHERGLYVDVVTGEPLFSSSDKYESGTGWPSFSKPIDENVIRHLEDRSLGVQRVEARSRAGNTHLGHIFRNDATSPSGIRYCMNSAALRFVPYAEMEAEGYSYLSKYIG